MEQKLLFTIKFVSENIMQKEIVSTYWTKLAKRADKAIVTGNADSALKILAQIWKHFALLTHPFYLRAYNKEFGFAYSEWSNALSLKDKKVLHQWIKEGMDEEKIYALLFEWPVYKSGEGMTGETPGETITEDITILTTGGKERTIRQIL